MAKFIEVNLECNTVELLNIDHIIAVSPSKTGCTIVTTDLDTFDLEDLGTNSIDYLSNCIIESTDSYETIRKALLKAANQESC